MKEQVLKWLAKNRPQDRGARAKVIKIWQNDHLIRERSGRGNMSSDRIGNINGRNNLIRISPLVVRRRKEA